jgi:hypothetical protein
MRVYWPILNTAGTFAGVLWLQVPFTLMRIRGCKMDLKLLMINILPGLSNQEQQQ